jgi:hypothetical protein
MKFIYPLRFRLKRVGTADTSNEDLHALFDPALFVFFVIRQSSLCIAYSGLGNGYRK